MYELNPEKRRRSLHIIEEEKKKYSSDVEGEKESESRQFFHESNLD
jgi:hypothetical protein